MVALLGANRSVLLVEADKALGLLHSSSLWQCFLQVQSGPRLSGTVWANAPLITDVVEHGSKCAEAACHLHGLVGGGAAMICSSQGKGIES